jgi:serine/threonine protein phosphatase PrpC
MPDVCDANVWCEVLTDADRQICTDTQCGETTCVVVGIRRDCIEGASVGDSGAWLIAPDSHRDLTRIQQRKPFLGSSEALPIPFRADFTDARNLLLVATDGLLKYASPDAICRCARSTDFPDAPKALIDLVRMPSGGLQDDVAVAVARLTVD